MAVSAASIPRPRRSRAPLLSNARTIVFIALRQIWERKLLNGIAVGGVTLGVLVLIAMNGIMQGFQIKFTSAILKISPHVIVFDNELRPEPPLLARYFGGPVAAHVAHESPSNRQARIKRPTEIVRALATMPEVEAAAASLQGMVLVEFGGKTKSLDLRGVDVAAQDKVTPIEQFVKHGRFATLAITTDGIAVGSGVADDLGLHVGDVVHAAAPGGTPLDLKVVAIFEAEIPPVDKVRGYASLRTLQILVGKPDIVGRIEIKLRDTEVAPAVAERIERAFGYDAESWQETNANFLGIFAMQNMIVKFVVGAILLVGGFGILAIQIMIVLQKQRDISILRSVGLRRADILRIFLLQGLIIATIGGLLGDGLGKVAIHFLSQLKVKSEGLVKSDTFLIYEDPKFYVYGFCFAILVGTIAALIPAWRGSKVEPVDVLRGQIG
ncbi:MAG: ABC transporter permease [Myxococcales bacterium]|nr:ABC transporter permease [Myxococcales bacterium]